MRLRFVILAVAVAAATWTAPVYAGHQLPHASPFSKMSLKQVERYQERSLRFHQTVVQRWVVAVSLPRFDRFIVRDGTHVDVAFPSTWRWCGMLGSVAPRNVCWHEHAIRWVRRELAATKTSLVPAVGHLDLWLCIHSGEGPWYANTGNGYYNGLQMTWGWLGYLTDSDKGKDPNAYTPKEIMAKAEQGYADSGYSLSWLYGQWPNTAPPCYQYAVH